MHETIALGSRRLHLFPRFVLAGLTPVNLIATDPEVGSTFLSMYRGGEAHGQVFMKLKTPNWLMAFHQIDSLNITTPTGTLEPEPFKFLLCANQDDCSALKGF